MAEFVFGRHTKKKNEYLLEKINDSLESGKNIVLIVPETQVLFWDTVCAQKLLQKYAFQIEVTSFTRLANNVFRRFGGVAEKYITDAEKLLLMWSALFSVADKLKAFPALDREDRYAPLFLKTVNEMKMYSVTPKMLADASDCLSDNISKPLSQKLYDLALVSEAYNTLVNASFKDPVEILDRLCQVLRENLYFENTSVFIDSFFSLTPKEHNVMREILRQTDDVTITFAISSKDRDRNICSFVNNYIKDMISLCKKMNREIIKKEIKSEKSSEAEYLFENFQEYTAVPYNKKTDKISIIRCNDRYDEAYLTVAKIKNLVMSGASFKEIAVVSSDFEKLYGITDTILENEGIPVYLTKKTALSSKAEFKLLLCAVNVIASGFKKESIVSLLKTGLCNLTPDECDAFEKYTAIWNINGKKNYLGDDWTMNPDGYTPEFSDWGIELLRLANNAKNTVIPILEDFSSAFSKDLKSICAAAYKLLCDFGVYEKIKADVKTLFDKGEYSAAQEKSQVWSSILSLLDTIALTLPDGKSDSFRFSAIIKKIADNISIGSIPDSIDRVQLGSASTMRLDGYKHIIILGAVSGEFPKVPSEDGYFSDADKVMLEGIGIELSPSTDRKFDEEMFRFLYTASSPEESLTVMIPLENGTQRPSLGVQYIERLFTEDSAFYADFSGKSGISLINHYMNIGKNVYSISLSAEKDKISTETAHEVFGEKLNLSQTKINAFNECPFKYYGQYILNLDDGMPAEIGNADVGVFVHKIFEDFMKSSKDEEFPIPEDILISKTERYIENYMQISCPKNLNARRVWAFNRLRNSILSDIFALNAEFSQSEFKPFKFELPIGFNKDGSVPSKLIPLSNGATLSLCGIIDRVDVYRDGKDTYVRIVDYKTGIKNFSKKSVLDGKNAQLLLYLYSLCKTPAQSDFYKSICPDGGKILPAGAMYFCAVPASGKSNTLCNKTEAFEISQGSIKRSGIVLNDLKIIAAMDKDFSGRYAPASLKKDGSFKSSSSVATLAQFDELENTLDQTLKDLGDSFYSGKASIPERYSIEDNCAFCNMVAFCRRRQEAKILNTDSDSDDDYKGNGGEDNE